MRNPRRTAGPIRRTLTTPPAPGPVATNLLLRTPPTIPPSVPVRRTRAVPMTGAQRDSTGARSDWNLPCHLRPMTTPMMPSWSRTVSDFPRISDTSDTPITEYREIPAHLRP